MDVNVRGLIVSYVYMLIVLGAAGYLSGNRIVTGEAARKIEHICMSSWWIIAMIFFTRPLYPAIAAGSIFILIFMSYRMHFFHATEPSSHRNSGVVYLSASLAILSILCFGWRMPVYCGAIGALIMGFGDGLASLAGKTMGRHEFSVPGSRKSLEGSAVMLIVSFAVVYIILTIYNPVSRVPRSLAIAAAAAAVEALTPYGLDNLTVPLSASFLFYFLFV